MLTKIKCFVNLLMILLFFLCMKNVYNFYIQLSCQKHPSDCQRPNPGLVRCKLVRGEFVGWELVRVVVLTCPHPRHSTTPQGGPFPPEMLKYVGKLLKEPVLVSQQSHHKALMQLCKTRLK